MDDEDIHDRLEQLEATVADQQATIEQLTEQPAIGRRSVVASLHGAGAVGGLAGYGSQSARAEASEPAGQVGTGEEPVDGYLWDLDVQNGAEFNDNDVTGVGALEAEDASVTNAPTEDTDVARLADLGGGEGVVVDENYPTNPNTLRGNEIAIGDGETHSIIDLEGTIDVYLGAINGFQIGNVEYVVDGSARPVSHSAIWLGQSENQDDRFSVAVLPRGSGVEEIRFDNLGDANDEFGYYLVYE